MAPKPNLEKDNSILWTAVLEIFYSRNLCNFVCRFRCHFRCDFLGDPLDPRAAFPFLHPEKRAPYFGPQKWMSPRGVWWHLSWLFGVYQTYFHKIFLKLFQIRLPWRRCRSLCWRRRAWRREGCRARWGGGCCCSRGGSPLGQSRRLSAHLRLLSKTMHLVVDGKVMWFGCICNYCSCLVLCIKTHGMNFKIKIVLENAGAASTP